MTLGEDKRQFMAGLQGLQHASAKEVPDDDIVIKKHGDSGHLGSASSRTGFVLKAGREGRVDNGPTEFFYGYVQLRRAGYDVSIVTDQELGLQRVPPRWWRIVSHGCYGLTGIPLWPLVRLARRASRLRLAHYDCLVVSTNTFGVCLGALARIGVIRPRILFIAMGLVQSTTPARLARVYQWLLTRRTAIVALSAIDAQTLSARLGLPVSHIPFGVDQEFWIPPSSSERRQRYVLSIGNDAYRDYATLLAAWKPEYPLLRIITNHPVVSDAGNVEILRGDWHRQLLSDEDIRRLLQEAELVVLPIADTVQPSGQSACLQAMACGAPVVITDFAGLWNRELLRDGDTCLYGGRPGDHAAIQRAVERLLGDRDFANAMGRRARAMIERELNVTKMANAMALEIAALTGPPS